MIGEKIVTRSQEYAESIINTVREPLIVLDQDLRVVSVSRSFYEVFKVNPEETMGQLIYDLDNKEWDIPRLRELLETILPQKTAFDDYEVEHVFSAIGRRIMLLNARQIEREMGKERIILLAIEDITEHKRLEDLVAESEARYMRFFETASDGIMLLEKREGHIVHANPAAEKMLGYTEEESIGKNLRDIGVLLDTSDFQEIMRSLNKSGILNYDDVPVKTRSGQDIYTDIYMVDGVRLAQCNIRDVSERKQKEENIQRMNRTLLARSKSSKAMISASDEAGYLDEVCRIIVEDCGHALVWIGFAEQNEGRSVRPVAHAGFDEGYLDLANITWSDTDRGRGPVGTAIRTGKPSVIRDILGGHAFAPWRDEAIKRGYAAVIGVPLLTAGKAFGSLNIYSRHQDPFSEDEVRLLIDLAADLSYGIAAIRLRTAQAEAEVALRESEKRFKLITETISEVFWMADSQSDKMLYISPGYELVWGRSLQSLYKNPHSYIEAIHADDRMRVHADHEVKTIGQAFDHEYRILRPDGTIRWVWDRGFPIYEPTGEVFRYVGIAQDITEYKILQEQHLQITREWEETFDTITDMVTVHDKDFNIIRANKAAEKMLGFSFLEAKKIKCFEYYHGTGCPPEGCPSCQTLVTGKACTTEVFEPHLNMFIEIRAIPRLDSNNLLVGLIHVVRDITERKKAETMLREERNNAQMYLDLAGVMIVALNSGGLITLINKKGLEILGYEEHEVVNRNWFELCIPGCVKEDVEGAFNKLMAGNIKPVEFYENTIITKGGEERILAFHNTVLWDVSGKISGTLSSGEDITERKKAEEEQKKLEAQLRHAQKMEAVGTLAGGVAHDFNNILNIIIGYGNMVMDKLEAGSPSIKNMSEVLIAADRAVNLTKRLLIFSRKQDVEVKPININELILGLQKMLVRIIRESIDIDLDLVDSPLIVQTDAGQIEQVLINLAVNAKDAMLAGGRLTISTGLEEMDEEYVAAHGFGKPGKYALITVTDTGHGMDAETQKKIFEPFFTTKDVGEGTGLGLAISYGIIKQHSGYIKAYSEPGQGTEFKIYLPLSEEAALIDKKTGAAVPVKRGNETVLVAEDDAALRKLTRIVLESFGYSVILAEDGEDAITKFMENRERISLVLLDMIMPKKNGKEVSEAIRKVSPRIKLLFASGYTKDIIKSKEWAEAGFDFIHKPFRSNDLLIKVREILDR